MDLPPSLPGLCLFIKLFLVAAIVPGVVVVIVFVVIVFVAVCFLFLLLLFLLLFLLLLLLLLLFFNVITTQVVQPLVAALARPRYGSPSLGLLVSNRHGRNKQMCLKILHDFPCMVSIVVTLLKSSLSSTLIMAVQVVTA